MTYTTLSGRIIGACIKVHTTLGPGLLESVYTECLFHELQHVGLHVHKEVPIPVKYEDLSFEKGFRADLIVEKKVIIEVKSVERLAPLHRAQTLTYLKLAELPLALLVNFGEERIKNGIYRFVNGPEGENL